MDIDFEGRVWKDAAHIFGEWLQNLVEDGIASFKCQPGLDEPRVILHSPLRNMRSPSPEALRVWQCLEILSYVSLNPKKKEEEMFDRSKWQGAYDRNSMPKFNCPNCRGGRLIANLETLKVVQPQFSRTECDHPDFEPGWERERFTLELQCDEKSCGETAFAIGNTCAEQYYDEELAAVGAEGVEALGEASRRAGLSVWKHGDIFVSIRAHLREHIYGALQQYLISSSLASGAVKDNKMARDLGL
ncbi:hypothetical protein [Pseudomonas coronafaciens]|uniref:hypothetical protein n=1 Tax=Pseudomonas coronafaciens TaxID=53409 RepID=UPI000B08913B|nr:hypothetical protein [Pseudomonas coronafaciens]